MNGRISTDKVCDNDVVELIEDQPEYGFVKGQRAVVINTFDEPGEAYDLAAETGDGEFLGFIYSVKPEQVIKIVFDG